LLVENYQLTAPVGLRIGWEFLQKPDLFFEDDCLFIVLASAAVEGEQERKEEEGLMET